MNARHVNFAVLRIRSNRDDVTSFQVENPACMRGTMVTFSWDRDLNHGYRTAVHLHKNPSSAVMVDLQVDIVPSSGRHSQLSIIVLHTACKMAVWGTERPVLYH